MPIKIKDIAQTANVSTGTVDRVLHNRSDVSKKTRKKVLKIIDELGYKTNIIAKTLASKNQIVFSILIPEPEKYSSYWQKPLIGIQKAEEELAAYGIKIKKYFFNLSDSNSFENKSTILLKENPNAVVLAPIFKNEALKLASGTYIALMDNDDEITPDALYEVVKLINSSNADFIYTDEDSLTMENKFVNPHFKPDYSPDLLLTQ